MSSEYRWPLWYPGARRMNEELDRKEAERLKEEAEWNEQFADDDEDEEDITLSDEDSLEDDDEREDKMAFLAKKKVLRARLRDDVDYVDTLDLDCSTFDEIESDYPELDFDDIRYRKNFDNVDVDYDLIESLIDSVDRIQELEDF